MQYSDYIRISETDNISFCKLFMAFFVILKDGFVIF